MGTDFIITPWLMGGQAMHVGSRSLEKVAYVAWTGFLGLIHSSIDTRRWAKIIALVPT